MSRNPVATWHRLKTWRSDADPDIRCRSCGIAIRVGDTYRVAGVYLLCTLRPFCPPPTVRVIEREKRRSPQWKRRSRTVLVGRPRRRSAYRSRLPVPRVKWMVIAICRCGKVYHQQIFKGVPQQACSRACTYRLLEERAAEKRRRACMVCEKPFAPLSSHPTQEACSPSCGARLRERRKRDLTQV
jgi:hypothetical protein